MQGYNPDEMLVKVAELPPPKQDVHAKPIGIHDINTCKTVIRHPYMTNLEYFLTEYARGLLVDMVRRPHIYRGVSFEKMYEAMAVQIINDNVLLEESPALQHACRAAGIPEKRPWIRTYIWENTNIKTRMMKPTAPPDRPKRRPPEHTMFKKGSNRAPAGKGTGTA